MKKFFKKVFALSLVFTLSFATVPTAFATSIPTVTQTNTGTTDVSKTSVSDATKMLAEKKAKTLSSFYGTTSVQYALIDNGAITLSGKSGVYSKFSNTMLTNDTMYGIGSISKLFTTTAIMQLVEKNKLNLDTPVCSYLPEFTMKDDRYKKITVRMLLNHSSGLLGSTLSNTLLLGDNDTYSHDNFLKSLKKQRLKAEPGAFSVYCNDGFTLAEILVEKISNMSFTKYISKNINKPLAMNNTKTPQDKFSRNKLAKSYIPGINKDIPFDSLNQIGAGGIYSTAEDLCKFSTIFMKDSDTSILNTSSIEAIKTNEAIRGIWKTDEDTNLNYGLGFDCVNAYPFNRYNIKALSKGGDTQLNHASIIILPDKNMAVAVLSSNGTSSYNQLLAQDILLSALKDKGEITEILKDKTFEKLPAINVPSDFKKYEGTYSSNTSLYKISFSDTKLILNDPLTTNSQKFNYIGNNQFSSFDGGTLLSFVKEKNDRTYIYVASHSTAPNLGQVASATYLAEKLPDNNVSDKVLSQWNKRNKKKYFCVSEKYSSQYYISKIPSLTITLTDKLPGYMGPFAIVSPTLSQIRLELPGIAGRDLSDISFYKKNSTEYLNANNFTYIDSNAIKNLSSKKTTTYKIPSNGESKWYKISKKSANKTITVKLPANSNFAIYDSKSNFVNDYYINKKKTVKLAKDGYILFAGPKNSKFVVSYK